MSSNIADPADFTAVVTRFLKSRLGGDAELTTIGSKGVSNTELPQAVTQTDRLARYPRTLFYFERSLDTSYGPGGHIRWVLMNYIVVGIGFSTSRLVIEQMSARQFRLLHLFGVNGGGAVVGGGFINSCAFDGPVNEIQTIGEDSYLRIGARWKIKARLSNSA